MSETWTDEQLRFINHAIETYGDGAILNQEQIKELSEAPGIQYPYWFIKQEYKVDRNKYKLPTLDFMIAAITNDEIEVIPVAADVDMDEVASYNEEVVPSVDGSMNFVPKKIPGYVTYGYFADVYSVVESKRFLPMFISGWSGNGKTTMVEHACAIAKRECIIANISIETDQSDLIGGPTLINGNVVNRDGPVILAMRRGAILLLDEIDRGSNKLLCLQTILEGKPYLNKQTNELIYPAKGFNVIATANTKGKGSEDGRYLSTILDDAFLERFPVTLEQDFATNAVEKKIVLNALKINAIVDDEFANILIKWSDRIRKLAKEGGVDDVISTRRLCHIVNVYGIFKNRQKAVDYCINRFDTETKKSFTEFYKMLDVGEGANPAPNNVAFLQSDEDASPF